MPKVTRAQLEQREALIDQASELRRRAATLTEGVKEIEAIAEADLKASGRASIVRAGRRITLAKKPGSVAWKRELLTRIGADAAAKIQADAPEKQVLQIEPPAEKPSQ